MSETEEEHWSQITFCKLTRRVNSKLQIDKHRLGYPSADKLLGDLLTVVAMNEWTKKDLENLKAQKVALCPHGKKERCSGVEEFNGSAPTDEAVYRAIGIRDDMKKVFESEEK